ncbi:uroporphyrinogen decarboxylase family protein [candidate division KSB1 bacterium]|nr:uroporphyrinogen decarboxylase family protein [candidate division KSB1 bacterium]
MNSYERMKSRLKSEAIDRPPNFNIFMTFAAHYIKQPLSKYYLDYRVLVDANMAMVENFNVDIVQAISDPFRETYDFGAKIEFPEDDLPANKEPFLDNPDKLKRLQKPNPSTGKRMSDRLNALRLMREKVGNEIPVMGWIEGALAEAADLRGITNVLMDIYERPQWLTELLEIITEVEIEFAKAQVEAGAHLIGLGDAIASQVSPAMYQEYALPYEKRIFQTVHEMGAITRLHICGDTSAIVPLMVQSGADIIDLDWMVNMKTAADQFGDQVAFCGNFDPVSIMLRGKPDNVYQATQKCMSDGGLNSFSAAGCEIPDKTPHENLKAQHQALIEMGNEK